jgi:hypothetical protein
MLMTTNYGGVCLALRKDGSVDLPGKLYHNDSTLRDIKADAFLKRLREMASEDKR